MRGTKRATVFFMLVLFLFLGGLGSAEQPERRELLQSFQLKVTGLDCEKCIPDVRKSLMKVSGVRDAEVTAFDKSGSQVQVEVVPKTASGEELVSALRSAGFKAQIIAVGEPRMVSLTRNSGFSLFGLFE
ncbi:MAG: heavy-metal-associated domain-containing protein [Nitrospinae bacterium]|nr:heavy-metal-associated domain-containing protein [Nitrospinota bacterium]